MGQNASNLQISISEDSLLHTGQFRNFASPLTIQFPRNLKRIPNNCFRNAKFSDKVIIPASVVSIGYCAFAYSDVKEIYFEKGSQLRVIHASAFKHCKNLVSLSLPQSLKTIGKSCFEGSGICNILNSSFNTCDISNDNNYDSMSSGYLNNLRTIGAMCFSQCQNIRSICIPTNVKEIQSATFSYSKLLKITFPKDSNMCIIGPEAFYNCIDYDSSFLVPKDTILIDQRAFYNSAMSDVVFCSEIQVTEEETNTDANIDRDANTGTNTNTNTNTDTEFGMKTYLRIQSESFSHIFENTGTMRRNNTQSMKNIQLPKNLLSLGVGVFRNSSMDGVAFHPSSFILQIPQYCFSTQNQIKKVVLSSNIRLLQDNAFQNTLVSNITIAHPPTKNKTIEQYISPSLDYELNFVSLDTTILYTSTTGNHSLLWIGDYCFNIEFKYCVQFAALFEEARKTNSMAIFQLPDTLRGLGSRVFLNANMCLFFIPNKLLHLSYVLANSFSCCEFNDEELVLPIVYLGSSAFYAVKGIKQMQFVPPSSMCGITSQKHFYSLQKIPPNCFDHTNCQILSEPTSQIFLVKMTDIPVNSIQRCPIINRNSGLILGQ